MVTYDTLWTPAKTKSFSSVMWGSALPFCFLLHTGDGQTSLREPKLPWHMRNNLLLGHFKLNQTTASKRLKETQAQSNLVIFSKDLFFSSDHWINHWVFWLCPIRHSQKTLMIPHQHGTMRRRVFCYYVACFPHRPMCVIWERICCSFPEMFICFVSANNVCSERGTGRLQEAMSMILGHVPLTTSVGPRYSLGMRNALILCLLNKLHVLESLCGCSSERYSKCI